MPCVAIITTLEYTSARNGQKTHRPVDLLGHVYDWSGATKTAAGSPKGECGGAHQYFLNRFASAEGKNSSQFYTPSCIVRCLAEILVPYKGRICDPACGSGCKLGDISIYGQEINATNRRLDVMNLALCDIEADFGPEHADTFCRDLRADYVLANGSMSSNQSREGTIRQALIEADLVDCTVTLPS